jgi:hypothetical protein
LIEFRPLCGSDLPLVAEWLARDHVRRSWRVRPAGDESLRRDRRGSEPALVTRIREAGFRHVRDVEEDGLPHRLMRHDRSA